MKGKGWGRGWAGLGVRHAESLKPRCAACDEVSSRVQEKGWRRGGALEKS